MNCRPGICAFIVEPYFGNTGKVVRLIQFLGKSPEYEGRTWARRFGPCWLVESEGRPITDTYGNEWRTAPVPQEWLRPFDDPGDDAVDEVIQRLGSPNKQEQKA